MSKAEKLNKICKKIWKRIIPIIIISAIIGAILIVPKCYNRGGSAIETSGLTVSPSYNWKILATSILGVLFISMLILVLILNSRRKSSKSETKIEPEKRKEEEKKKTWGQVIKMWLFIIIIVIPVTWGVGKIIWTATSRSMLNTFGVNSKGTPASYIWKKKPHQYGHNPEKRTSGYLNAVVTKNDEKNFCFTVNVNGIDSHYTGKYVDVGKNRIEGAWRNPPNGGKWYLEKDEKKPNFFKGGITDLDLEGWADLELEIF